MTEWYIYIPDEGDWPINYNGRSHEQARLAYLQWAGRQRLPAGAVIWSR
jgi:hypothetical protein